MTQPLPSSNDTCTSDTNHSAEANCGPYELGRLNRRALLSRGAASAGALAAGSLLSACGGGTQANARTVGSTSHSPGGGKPVAQVTFAAENDAVSMDPCQAYDFVSNLVVPTITEQLFRMNPAGQLTPNLAASYDLSDPGRLVLKIRSGVRFHDGTPMTPEDVAFSLQRNLSPKTSLLNYYYQHVAYIAVTGSDEVTVFMKRPDIQFLNALSTNAGGVTSKAFVQKWGKQFGSPQVGSMGTGPYRFVSWDKGSSFTVARNPDYWNGVVVPRKVETFTVRVISDETTLLAALRTGELDGQMGQLSGRGVQSLASATNINQYRTSSGGGSLLSFNVLRAPWNDARVRQALSLVIPRQGLVDSIWGGQATLVKSPVTPSDWSYAKPSVPGGLRRAAGLRDHHTIREQSHAGTETDQRGWRARRQRIVLGDHAVRQPASTGIAGSSEPDRA